MNGGPRSAGLLLYRRRGGTLEVLLVHPGGPFFRNRDAGAWSIPKGELEPGEEPLAAARREVAEELGLEVAGDCLDLGTVRQRGGKTVAAFACETDSEEPPKPSESNTFELEWPPRSGRRQRFPENDRAAFFDAATARARINAAQAAFIDRLEARLSGSGPQRP